MNRSIARQWVGRGCAIVYALYLASLCATSSETPGTPPLFYAASIHIQQRLLQLGEPHGLRVPGAIDGFFPLWETDSESYLYFLQVGKTFIANPHAFDSTQSCLQLGMRYQAPEKGLFGANFGLDLQRELDAARWMVGLEHIGRESHVIVRLSHSLRSGQLTTNYTAKHVVAQPPVGLSAHEALLKGALFYSVAAEPLLELVWSRGCASVPGLELQGGVLHRLTGFDSAFSAIDPLLERTSCSFGATAHLLAGLSLDAKGDWALSEGLRGSVALQFQLKLGSSLKSQFRWAFCRKQMRLEKRLQPLPRAAPPVYQKASLSLREEKQWLSQYLECSLRPTFETAACEQRLKAMDTSYAETLQEVRAFLNDPAAWPRLLKLEAPVEPAGSGAPAAGVPVLECVKQRLQGWSSVSAVMADLRLVPTLVETLLVAPGQAWVRKRFCGPPAEFLLSMNAATCQEGYETLCQFAKSESLSKHLAAVELLEALDDVAERKPFWGPWHLLVQALKKADPQLHSERWYQDHFLPALGGISEALEAVLQEVIEPPIFDEAWELAEKYRELASVFDQESLREGSANQAFTPALELVRAKLKHLDTLTKEADCRTELEKLGEAVQHALASLPIDTELHAHLSCLHAPLEKSLQELTQRTAYGVLNEALLGFAPRHPSFNAASFEAHWVAIQSNIRVLKRAETALKKNLTDNPAALGALQAVLRELEIFEAARTEMAFLPDPVWLFRFSEALTAANQAANILKGGLTALAASDQHPCLEALEQVVQINEGTRCTLLAAANIASAGSRGLGLCALIEASEGQLKKRTLFVYEKLEDLLAQAKLAHPNLILKSGDEDVSISPTLPGVPGQSVQEALLEELKASFMQFIPVEKHPLVKAGLGPELEGLGRSPWDEVYRRILIARGGPEEVTARGHLPQKEILAWWSDRLKDQAPNIKLAQGALRTKGDLPRALETLSPLIVSVLYTVVNTRDFSSEEFQKNLFPKLQRLIEDEAPAFRTLLFQ